MERLPIQFKTNAKKDSFRGDNGEWIDTRYLIMTAEAIRGRRSPVEYHIVHFEVKERYSPNGTERLRDRVIYKYTTTENDDEIKHSPILKKKMSALINQMDENSAYEFYWELIVCRKPGILKNFFEEYYDDLLKIFW